MTPLRRKIGWIALFTGVLTLAAAILCAFAVGTVAVPILFITSILLNAAGATLLRRRK